MVNLRRRAAVVLVSILAGGLGTASTATAAPLCRVTSGGPIEYSATLSPLLTEPRPAVPAPGQPPLPPAPPSTNGGASAAAREALGSQFSTVWLSNAVQGWVTGLAPGPLDVDAARAAIIDRLVPRFSASQVAYLADRLHVDPQPYGESELAATREAVVQALRATPTAPYFGLGMGCRLSDSWRIEVTVFSPASPEQMASVASLLEPFGDKVRVELVPYGPPPPAVAPLQPSPISPLAPTPLAPEPLAPVAFDQHVKMPTGRSCVRGGQVHIAARDVRALTVRANGRSRTIAGRRLAKPITVVLHAPRTDVVVTVRLAGGRVATRTVTYTRCS